MYSWFTTTIPMITFITSITGSITIATLLLYCAIKKSKRPYKPGHLLEFVDPDAKEADTYYGMRSTVAFPIKGTTIERKDDFKVPQASADIESELGIKQPDIPDREVQSESTPVQEDSRPIRDDDQCTRTETASKQTPNC